MITSGMSTATVRIKPDIICRGCSVVEKSQSTMTLCTDLVDVSTLLDVIKSLIETSAVDIPVGWSQYGRGNHFCPKCKPLSSAVG